MAISDFLNNTIEQEALLNAHKLTAVPNLIILYIGMGIIFLLVYGVQKISNHERISFAVIFVLSMIFSTAVLLPLILFPEIAQFFVNVLG